VTEQRYQAVLGVIAEGRAVIEVASQWGVTGGRDPKGHSWAPSLGPLGTLSHPNGISPRSGEGSGLGTLADRAGLSRPFVQEEAPNPGGKNLWLLLAQPS
jgi:hypothetical protein